MKNNTEVTNKALFEFIGKSPTAYQAVDNIAELLTAAGYESLSESDHWEIEAGKNYYVTRNSSSIVAFHIGERMQAPAFRICASHSDSPMFKIKENAEISVRDKYVRLDTEGYGGMICYSWMDRPLSIAGRIIVKENGKLCEKLVDLEKPVVLIPSLAIHMNRKINDGVEFNKQKDMLPLIAGKAADAGVLRGLIADAAGVDKDSILGQDLYVYDCMEGVTWGADGEFISAPRLDDLMCAYASLMGMMGSANEDTVSVYCCFDNEEVGSQTRQGAGSSLLSDILERVGEALGWSREDYHRAIAESFMLSEDNGHAVHPAYPEKSDPVNVIYMNEGIVVKSHAGQKYASDAVGVALCRDICDENDIPVQFYSNRSDEAGGSTLGNIAISNVPVRAVDIGLAQLAMHSAYETAGAKDLEYMYRFSEAFYNYGTI